MLDSYYLKKKRTRGKQQQTLLESKISHQVVKLSLFKDRIKKTTKKPTKQKKPLWVKSKKKNVFESNKNTKPGTSLAQWTYSANYKIEVADAYAS